MTTTAAQATLHKSAAANVLHAGKTAKGLSKVANAKRSEDEQALQSMDAPKSKGAVDGASATPFEAKAAVKGHSYSTSGIVVYDGPIAGQRVVFLVRLDGPNQYQVLGFRPHDPNMPAVPLQSVVQVTGVYAAKIKDPKTGTLVHGFDSAVFSAAPSAQAPAADAKEAKEEKPTLTSVLKGWQFRGTVEVEGHTTGVFVNDGDLKYAHAGSELGEGVKVAGLESGKARMVVDGRKLEVAPW